MNSPLHPDVYMRFRELEPGLGVYECPQSGGVWIPLQSYLAWRDQQPEAPATRAQDAQPVFHDDSHQRALICPESGRVLLRYRVGQGFHFHLDRSPATGGVWLDKGEWAALKSKGLHLSLNMIFTAAYQRQLRTAEYHQRMTDVFRDRIGEDFEKVAEFRNWLAGHPRRRDICCYLLDAVEVRNEMEHGPSSAEAEARGLRPGTGAVEVRS